MKKIIVISVLFALFIGNNAIAQKPVVKRLTTFDDKRLHFGFTLSVNSFDFSFTHYNSVLQNPSFDVDLIDSKYKPEVEAVNYKVRGDVAKLSPGFSVGIVSNLRLTEYLDLRFLPRLSFGARTLVYNLPVHDVYTPLENESYTIRSTYVDFPLLVKYKSKRLNNQRPYVIAGANFRYDISKVAIDDLVRLKDPGFYIEFVIGHDIYLQFFRLSP